MDYGRHESGLLLPRRRIHVLKLQREELRGPRGELLDLVEYGPREGLNLLHDEGEQAILSAYFDTDLAGFGAPPASVYLGLDNRAALAEADTLASLSGEPAGNGYARKAVSTATGFTLSQPGAYYKATSATVTQTASGGSIGPVSKLFLATTLDNLGKLIASIALSTSRTLAAGESLDLTMAVGLSE